MEEAKVSHFFPGTLVPPGLGCNTLDSGWHIIVPGKEWSETLSYRN